MKGYIRERTRGSWEVILTLKDPETGKWRQRTCTVRGSKKDAERKRRELLYQYDTGNLARPSTVRLADFLRRWLEDWARPNVGPQTFLRYKIIVERRLVPLVGNVKLVDLKPADIASAIGKWQAEGLAPRTVLKHYRVLSQALKRAVRWQLIDRNPAEAVDRPRVVPTIMITLDERQVETLLAVASREMAAFIYFAVFTGLRQGEQLALHWRDVDLDRGALSVTHNLHWLPGTGPQFPEPKASYGRRKVELPASVVKVMRKIRISQAEKRLMLGPAYQDHDLVFAHPDGRPIDPNNLRKRFKKTVAEAGIGKCRLHDLRHTHASLMLARGVHPKSYRSAWATQASS